MARQKKLPTFGLKPPVKVSRRRGLGVGQGKGYRNMLPQDRYVHYLAGKGITIYQPIFKKLPMGHNPLELSLYIPSTKGKKKLTKKEFDKRINNAEKKMSNLFGGYTQIDTTGGWVSGNKLIEEPVATVTSFTTIDNFEKNKAEFENYVEEIRNKYKQESIAIEFEGDLYFYEPKDTDKDSVPDYKDCAPLDPKRQHTLTSLRNAEGNRPSTEEKNAMIKEIEMEMEQMGYDSFVDWDGNKIKFGNVRLSDKYIKEQGYNLSPYTGRRGRILNWENWVQVNNKLNETFDRKGWSANIQSLGGKFRIRKGKQAFTEDDWEEFAYENVGSVMRPVTRREAWRSE